MDEHPGPPFSHKARGAVLALLRASKNQKNMDMFVPTDKYPEYVLTPGVVSQMPESSTRLRLLLVSRCSKTLYVTPLSSRLCILLLLLLAGLLLLLWPPCLLEMRRGTDLGTW